MRNKKWIETKKEFDIGENGEYIPKKVTVELDSYRKKDFVDIFLKLLPIPITIFSVLIPVYIFFQQQKKESVRQRRLFEIETFTKTTSDIQLLLHSDNADLKSIKDELYFSLYPKLKFIGDKSIIELVDTIKTTFNYYFLVANLKPKLDSFIIASREYLQAYHAGVWPNNFTIAKRDIYIKKYNAYEETFLFFWDHCLQIINFNLVNTTDQDLKMDVKSDSMVVLNNIRKNMFVDTSEVRDYLNYSIDKMLLGHDTLYYNNSRVQNRITQLNLRLDSIFEKRIASSE